MRYITKKTGFKIYYTNNTRLFSDPENLLKGFFANLVTYFDDFLIFDYGPQLLASFGDSWLKNQFAGNVFAEKFSKAHSQ